MSCEAAVADAEETALVERVGFDPVVLLMRLAKAGLRRPGWLAVHADAAPISVLATAPPRRCAAQLPALAQRPNPSPSRRFVAPDATVSRQPAAPPPPLARLPPASFPAPLRCARSVYTSIVGTAASESTYSTAVGQVIEEWAA